MLSPANYSYNSLFMITDLMKDKSDSKEQSVIQNGKWRHGEQPQIG